MARYIEAGKIIWKYEEIKAENGYKEGTEISDYTKMIFLAQAIDEMPEADVAPIKHGKWIQPESWIYECSLCGEWMSTDLESINMTYRFCPNCGARNSR